MDLEDIQKHDIKLRISKSTNTNSHDAISKSFIIDLFYGIAKLAIKYYKHDLYS